MHTVCAGGFLLWENVILLSAVVGSNANTEMKNYLLPMAKLTRTLNLWVYSTTITTPRTVTLQKKKKEKKQKTKKKDLVSN